VNARLVVAALCLFVATFTLGCPSPQMTRSVSLYPESGAPPARKLEVVTSDAEHRVMVNSGVAFAVSLSDNCPYEGAPIPRPSPTMTIADETILASRPLVRGASDVHFVLWGAKPGQTTLTLHAWCATQVYTVSVVAP
jgi:hypothetical protein